MNSNIKILDCTLRDGGYINNWEFDNNHIKDIIKSLVLSGIEIIECGFISHKKGKDKDSTLFKDISIVNNLIKDIGVKETNSKFVCLMNYGDCDVNNFPICDKSDKFSITGLRLAFHKENIEEAYNDIAILIDKGYDVFVQPMVTKRYNDSELLELIHKFNKLDAYAMYIVDSFGSMNQFDFQRLYYLFENNVDPKMYLGYHSHNNLQLAFSNAILFLNISGNNRIIADSSVYGMGRGAGNLNTELFADFLNKNLAEKYKITPILDIIEGYLLGIFKEKSWGFSPANFLSASFECHPNYASFLTNKKTITIVEIKQILSEIPESKKSNFDKDFISELYLNFNASKLNNKQIKTPNYKGEVLILASGPSIKKDKEIVQTFISSNKPVVVSMNSVNEDFNIDYSFFSNQKRYDKYSDSLNAGNLIVSSNVRLKEKHLGCYVLDYEKLMLNSVNKNDNVSVLFLKHLRNIGEGKVSIAGLDGYNIDSFDNYSYKEYDRVIDKANLQRQNDEISFEIKGLQQKMELNFITESIFE